MAEIDLHPAAESRAISISTALNIPANMGTLEYRRSYKAGGQVEVAQSGCDRPSLTITKARNFSGKRYGDKVASLDKPIGTITRLSRWFLTEQEEFSLDAYKRLASYPDRFQFIGESSGKSRIGNSVPPLFMRAIAARISERLFGKMTWKPEYTGDYPALLDEAWQQHLAPREPDAPTVISTFAGCGGSSLGYSMAGYRELLAVEWDDNAGATFKLNFPGVPVYHGDIAKLSVEQCLEMAQIEPGELDVLDGSPPCQGFSTAGKRDMDDDRNQLFREYARLLRGLRPRAFVMENVSGLVKGKMKLIFAEIMRELKASGYKVSCRLMNAMYFHVPQSRQRLIFIGVRDDLAAEPGHPGAGAKPIIVRCALKGLNQTKKNAALGHCWIDAKPGSKTAMALAQTPEGARLRGFAMARRLAWGQVAGTIQTGGCAPGYPGSSWPSHPTEPRGISTREAARLASYPDAFEFRDWRDGAKRIGNSVPPLFMRAIAQHVRNEVLNAHREH